MSAVSINPAGPQNGFGFDQARLVRGAGDVLATSGQVGDRHEDLAGQVRGALDAIAELVAQAGMSLSDVIKLTIFTTDVQLFLTAWPAVQARFAPHPVPPNSLLQVSRFAHPKILVEIDAIAVQAVGAPLA